MREAFLAPPHSFPIIFFMAKKRKKKFPDVKASYLYEGEVREVAFKMTEKDYGHYKMLRVRANPKGMPRLDKEAKDISNAHILIDKWRAQHEPDLSKFREMTTRLTHD